MNQELESWVVDVKYKEFWIDHCEWYSKEEKEFNDRTCTKEEWNASNLVHTIEYAAFEAAQSEIERLKKELEELKEKDK